MNLFDDTYAMDDEGDPLPGGRVCNRCGTEGLTWDDSSGDWKLVDGNGVNHRCAADDEGFESLED